MPLKEKSLEFEGILNSIASGADSASLDLSHFGLTDQDLLRLLEAIAQNPKFALSLQTLNLSHNRLENFPLEIVFPNLLTLDLGFNRIRTLEGQLANTPALQTLSLRDNHLSYIESLPCPALIQLDLSANQFEHAPDLSQLSALRQLDLHNNLLICPPVLVNHAALEYLNLNGNHIPIELADLFRGVLQQYLPNIQLNLFLPAGMAPPSFIDSEGLRQYCIVWAEHYCQQFVATALNDEKIFQFACLLAYSKVLSSSFPNLTHNIKQSVSDRFFYTLDQFLNTLHWLIQYSGTMHPHLTPYSFSAIEEAKQFGTLFFHRRWEMLWSQITELSDSIRKTLKGADVKPKIRFDRSLRPNPFMEARQPAAMGTFSAPPSLTPAMDCQIARPSAAPMLPLPMPDLTQKLSTPTPMQP